MPELITSGALVEARRSPAVRQLLMQCAEDDAPVIARQAGLTLPRSILVSTQSVGWSALHLGPQEWLLIGELYASAIESQFTTVSQPHSIVDVSERDMAIDITGANSAALLNGACPLDFSSIEDGACTRTLFGKATVLVWRRGDGFRMSYARSFDAYVTDLLSAIAADLADAAA